MPPGRRAVQPERPAPRFQLFRGGGGTEQPPDRVAWRKMQQEKRERDHAGDDCNTAQEAEQERAGHLRFK